MDQQHYDLADLSYLRRELLLRMAVQNLVLLINAGALALFLMLCATGTLDQETLGALAQVALTAILAAIWCHHGARQAQIKAFILSLQSRHGLTEGWESWLPQHGFAGRLGSRWFVSTKATFIGSAVLALAIAGLLDRDAMAPMLLGVGAAGTAGLTALLLTNPKEGLAPIR